MHTILLVEDEVAIRDYYTGALTDAGFNVVAHKDSASALQQFETSPPDLALLDITLGEDTDAGFHLCAELRTRSKVLPIIFLTALDSDFDKISGMRLGADDYITKDISVEYLIVRIKALLNRVEALSDSNNKSNNKIKQGDLSVSMDTLSAFWKGERVDLSLTQLWMVHALASKTNCVRTPQQLMDAANITVESNTVTVHINNIRNQFQLVDPGFSAIRTERGIGYRFCV